MAHLQTLCAPTNLTYLHSANIKHPTWGKDSGWTVFQNFMLQTRFLHFMSAWMMRFCLFSTLFFRSLYHLLLHIYLPGLTKALCYKNWNVTLSPPESQEQQLVQSAAKYQVLMTGVKVNRRRLWVWTAVTKKSDFLFYVFFKSSTSNLQVLLLLFSH